MASAKKQVLELARQFFKLSLVDGRLSDDRVAGVLQYIEKHRPVQAVAVLKAYARLVAAEVARGQAVVDPHRDHAQRRLCRARAPLAARRAGRAAVETAQRRVWQRQHRRRAAREDRRVDRLRSAF